MTTLREAARAFVPKQTKNISELSEVSTDVQIFHDGKGMDDAGKEFFYSYLSLNGEEYRVPNSVIGQLKDLLEAKPEMTKFKVKKSGQAMQTRYTVIPL